MPSGCAAYRNDCSTSRSSCYDWRIRNPSRRSCGNRLRAGAGWRSIPPTNRSGSCDRWSKWFLFLSDHNHSYIPDSRSAYTLRPAHSPAPRCDCRSPGKSKNHTSRNHDLYTHKCRDFLCNDIYSTRSTRHGRARCALWKRRCPAKNTVCSLGRCRQCR